MANIATGEISFYGKQKDRELLIAGFLPTYKNEYEKEFNKLNATPERAKEIAYPFARKQIRFEDVENFENMGENETFIPFVSAGWSI